MRDKVYTSGRYLKVPLFEKVKMYDFRERTHIVEAAVSTREKIVKARIEVRAQIRQILPFVKHYGIEYDGRVNEQTKFALGNSWTLPYSVEELRAEKENISIEVQKLLAERFARFDIAINNVCITSIIDDEYVDFVKTFVAGTNGIVQEV